MMLYTIGFTQKTAERFFSLLAEAGVERVVDIRLMERNELIGWSKPDVVEQVRGWGGVAGAPGVEGGAQPVEVVRPGVEVPQLLAQLAPDLLDRIAPGGVGRQRDELDRQVERAPLPACRRARLRWPVAGRVAREGRHLRLKGDQEIGMPVDRPVVEDDPEPGALWAVATSWRRR